jgi:hypothetical protein
MQARTHCKRCKETLPANGNHGARQYCTTCSHIHDRNRAYRRYETRVRLLPYPLYVLSYLSTPICLDSKSVGKRMRHRLELNYGRRIPSSQFMH